MPEYRVEVPMQFTLEAPSALAAYVAALARADALTWDAPSYLSIKETDRAYSPARVQETLASRKKSIAAVIVDAKEHPNNE